MMCRYCWAKVPWDMQAAIHAAHRDFREARESGPEAGAALTTYHELRSAAIKHVEDWKPKHLR